MGVAPREMATNTKIESHPMETTMENAKAAREASVANAGLDAMSLTDFDRAMVEDERTRYYQLDKMIREKFGGIHPLYGSRAMQPAYDSARDLPLHGYPYARGEGDQAQALKQFDYPYHLDRMGSKQYTNGPPQVEIDRTNRYASPLDNLTDDDLDAIDRHRHQAIKARLEHNGYQNAITQGDALYPGTKYPLTGPPIFQQLASGHPLLQPETTPKLLSAVPELRSGQLLEDSVWLAASEQHAAARAEENSCYLHHLAEKEIAEREMVMHHQAQSDEYLAARYGATLAAQREPMGMYGHPEPIDMYGQPAFHPGYPQPYPLPGRSPYASRSPVSSPQKVPAEATQ